MPAITVKEPPERKLTVPDDLLAYYQDTGQSAEQYEAALQKAISSFEFFSWGPNNPHVIGDTIAYADRVSIVVHYDFSYYIGPEDKGSKSGALKDTAKNFADVYLMLHPDKRVRVVLKVVNAENPNNWPTVYYSSPQIG